MSLPSAPGPNGENTKDINTAAAGPLIPAGSEPRAPEPISEPNPEPTPTQLHPAERLDLELTELRLDQFLKWQGLVGTGGEAKFRIQRGDVRVNGSLEQRRGRKLQPGDRVNLAGQELEVPPFQARR